MYGGNANPNITGNMTTAQISQFDAYDEVYVLSLPAFAWFKADYTAMQSRQKHTCEVFGRQMLSIGGYSTTDNNLGHLSTDRFSQGLGIFDLTAMQWSDSYDANAEPYQTPDVVKAWYRENGTSPVKWDDPALEGFFQKASVTGPGSSAGPTSETPSPTPSKAASSNSHPSHTGAIAGGVVGGIAAVCVLAGLIFWLLRRKRRRDGDRLGYAAPKELPAATSEKNRVRQELPEDYRPPEMDGAHPTMELDGRGQSYLWKMKMPQLE